MITSPVQNYIISRLKNADTLRFTDLKPEGLENDAFNYHLKTLIKKSLVTRTPNGYALTSEGERYVADVFHTSDQANRLFKINVITIVTRVVEGEIQVLNQERLAQPSFGKIGVMGGTIVKGEAMLDGASRKLLEETGVQANFRLVGQERRMRYRNDELFSDVLFPICYASESKGEPQSTEYGRNFWVPIAEAIAHEQDPHDSIAAIHDVLVAVRDGILETMPLFYSETTQYAR